MVSRDAGDGPEVRADQQRGVVVPTSDRNFRRAPSADVLKAPVFATIAAANTVETQLSLNFVNLAPVLFEQLGLQAKEGEREAARVIDEAVVSYQPLIAYFIGVDTDPVRAALEENTVVADAPEKETTLYRSALEDGSPGGGGSRERQSGAWRGRHSGSELPGRAVHASSVPACETR